MNFKEISLKEFYAKRLVASLGQNQGDNKPWYQIQNKAGDEVDITIFDFIGLYGVSASDFVAVLRDLQGKNISVHLNSPGGDVFDGIAIFNSLKNHSGRVRVVVDGIAASAASLIAMAGETITMNQGAMMMIHDAWSITVGDAEDHLQMADTLNRVSGELAGIYAQRTGTGTRTVRQMMKDTTWMTAKEAEEAGFADAVEGQANAHAQAQTFTVPQGFTLGAFDNGGIVMATGETSGSKDFCEGVGVADPPRGVLRDVRHHRLALAARGEKAYA